MCMKLCKVLPRKSLGVAKRHNAGLPLSTVALYANLQYNLQDRVSGILSSSGGS